MLIHTVCSEKKHPLTFSFVGYLRGKCFDLHKIFRIYLRGIRHSIDVKIKYSLLSLTGKHFIKCLFSTVKPIIYKHINKMSLRITSPVTMNI